MIVRTLTAMLTVVILSGCTSTQTIERSDGAVAYDAVNRGVRGKVVRVLLRDGSTMDIVGVRLDANSLTWINGQTNTLESVPVQEVRQVSVVKATSGAVRGLIAGVIAGAAFGGVRAALEGDDPKLDIDPLALTREEKFRIYPVAHAVYASLISTPIGAILGTRRIYRFEGTDLAIDP